MRTLIESILDDEILDRTEYIPMPELYKSDYFYYEQAWFNLVNKIKQDKENLRLFFKIYIEYKNPYGISIAKGDLERYDYLISTYHEETVYNTLIDYVHLESEWYNKTTNIFLNRLIDSINNKDDIHTYLFHKYSYEGELYKIYRKNIFGKNIKYKKFYKYIKNILYKKGIVFK